MRKILRRTRLVLLPALAVTGLLLGTGGSAHATQQQICGNGGSGYCMNDWNGSNQYVKMYYGNSSHEDFGFIFNYTECGGGKVTSTMQGDSADCPFVNKYLDDTLHNDPIGQIEYWPTGQCIGTTTAGTAWLGNCANSSGVGGGTGSTLIDYNLGPTDALIDRYWSDYYSSGQNYFPCFLVSGGNPGTYLYMNSGIDSSGTCKNVSTDWGGA